MDKLKIAIIVVLISLLMGVPAAQDQATNICSSSGVMKTPPIFGSSNISGQGQLLEISALLMLTMLMVSIIAYMLGTAFNINLLLKFSKDEMREVAITCLIVLVFIGAFSTVSGTSGFGTFVTKAATGNTLDNVFTKDCTTLASTSLNMINIWALLSVDQNIFTMISSLTVAIQPGDFGPFMSPLSGLSPLTDTTDGLIGNFAMFTGVMAIFFMTIAIMIGIFYSIFPLFFYVGIVLRTLPFTRAAGGSFLGLFIAFYFAFPFFIYFFLLPSSQAVVSVQVPSTLSLPTFQPDQNNWFNTITTFLNIPQMQPILPYFMSNVVEPSFYLILGVVFSLMMSMDFMETLGDMLGSPALSQRGALRGLI